MNHSTPVHLPDLTIPLISSSTYNNLPNLDGIHTPSLLAPADSNAFAYLCQQFTRRSHQYRCSLDSLKSIKSGITSRTGVQPDPEYILANSKLDTDSLCVLLTYAQACHDLPDGLHPADVTLARLYLLPELHSDITVSQAADILAPLMHCQSERSRQLTVATAMLPWAFSCPGMRPGTEIAPSLYGTLLSGSRRNGIPIASMLRMYRDCLLLSLQSQDYAELLGPHQLQFIRPMVTAVTTVLSNKRYLDSQNRLTDDPSGLVYIDLSKINPSSDLMDGFMESLLSAMLSMEHDDLQNVDPLDLIALNMSGMHSDVAISKLFGELPDDTARQINELCAVPLTSYLSDDSNLLVVLALCKEGTGAHQHIHNALSQAIQSDLPQWQNI